MKPTPQQQHVIDAPIGNLLVSAAAGSGKTSVLVERIMKMITRAEDPIDIDSILIVTFTRNAANEMRGRIERAIEEALSKDPDNELLQRQARNIHFAKISTIDSFCQSVVRRYCHLLDIDPGFRLLDESEAKLLRADTVGEVLEQAYEEATSDFLELVNRYGGKTGDGDLESMLTELVNKCESAPFPEKWLAEKLQSFTETQDPYESAFAKEIYTDSISRIRDMKTLLEAFQPHLTEPGMPPNYIRVMQADDVLLSELAAASDIRELSALLSGKLEWMRADATKQEKELTDKDCKKICEEVRKKYKDVVSKEADHVEALAGGIEVMQSDCVPSLRALCELALRVWEKLVDKQHELRAYDFTTMAHMALEILLDENGDPTAAAIQLSGEFAEIMIDEYQDSNMLQEYLLGAITRPYRGIDNMFMVGDVKQSIYRFRKARPELFIGKCDEYLTYDPETAAKDAAETGAKGFRIDLQKNFRSRKQVLDSVNVIFRELMHRNVGDVEYDERAELVYGEGYDKALWNDEDYRSELLIAVGDEEQPVVNEANMIIDRIRELTDPVTGLRVMEERPKGVDPETWVPQGRIARYSDIVVLTRSRKELYNELLRRLQRNNIPAYSASMDGFYDSMEVKTLVDVLRVVDNPFQDLPLTDVLMSPVIGFTADDLGRIAVLARKGGEKGKSRYFQTVIREIADGKVECRDELRERCAAWIGLYDLLKRHAAYVSAAEIIEEFLQKSGFREYCSALPDSTVRRRNIRVLMERADRFRKDRSGRISEFLAAIDNAIRFGGSVDNTAGGSAPNAVCLMTVHSSKGLEFPIVFVADTTKQFNTKELTRNLLLHDDIGFGPKRMFPEVRMSDDSIAKKAVYNRLLRDMIGEEMRLLYVAMTRAKEKLIVTGRLSNEDLGAKLGSVFRYGNRVCYADMVAKGTSNFTLMLRAILSGCAPEDIEQLYTGGMDVDEIAPGVSEWAVRMCRMKKADEAELAASEKAEVVVPFAAEEQQLVRAYTEEMKRYRDYEYPHAKTVVPAKVSVSTIKKQAYLEAEAKEEAADRAENMVRLEPGEKLRAPEEDIPVPSFTVGRLTEDPAKLATEYGTLYHRVLQLHDYSLPATEKAFYEEIRSMCERKMITEEEGGKLRPERFLAFYESDLGLRMKKAFDAGKLRRERAFIMAEPAADILADCDSRETTLVQGVIDAYFEEDDGEITVVDYKTDRVDEKSGEQELRKRYARQLQLYAEAVSRGTGKTVKESIIYSFALNKSIVIGYNDMR